MPIYLNHLGVSEYFRWRWKEDFIRLSNIVSQEIQSYVLRIGNFCCCLKRWKTQWDVWVPNAWFCFVLNSDGKVSGCLILSLFFLFFLVWEWSKEQRQGAGNPADLIPVNKPLLQPSTAAWMTKVFVPVAKFTKLILESMQTKGNNKEASGRSMDWFGERDFRTEQENLRICKTIVWGNITEREMISRHIKDEQIWKMRRWLNESVNMWEGSYQCTYVDKFCTWSPVCTVFLINYFNPVWLCSVVCTRDALTNFKVFLVSKQDECFGSQKFKRELRSILRNRLLLLYLYQCL